MNARAGIGGDFALGGRSYLNSASVSVQTHESIRAMARFAEEYCSLGPDSIASEPLVKETLAAARRTAAGLIGAQPDEITLTQSVTDGINAVAGGMRAGSGANVVIRGGAHEHHSNYYAWLRLAQRGIGVRSARIGEHGLLADGELRRLVDGRTALVALSHALYNTGAILPIAEIGEELRRAGVPLFLDAAQTVGCTGELDARRLGCDYMAFNGSKWLCGPMGTGFFYCRRDAAERLEPLSVGGESAILYDGDRLAYKEGADRFQAGFRNYAGMAALAASVDHMRRYGLDRIRRAVMDLADMLREEILRIPGAEVYGPDDPSARTSIVPFSLASAEPAAAVAALESQGIVMAVREIHDKKIVRASPHYFNTREEIAAAADALRAL